MKPIVYPSLKLYESPGKWSLYEDLRTEHGVHHFKIGEQVVAGMSASTWEEYQDQLLGYDGPADLIISPELVTVAGISWDSENQLRATANERLFWMLNYSRDHPGRSYLLGAATYDGFALRNSAVLIRDGYPIGQTNKRSQSDPDERVFFKPDVSAQPYILEGTDTGVLICSDLFYSHYLGVNRSSEERMRRWGKLTGQEELFRIAPEMIADGVKRLIVLSCWGVGTTLQDKDRAQSDVDRDYLEALRMKVKLFMDSYPNIDEIVMVDRTARGAQGLTASIPFNVKFVRPPRQS